MPARCMSMPIWHCATHVAHASGMPHPYKHATCMPQTCSIHAWPVARQKPGGLCHAARSHCAAAASPSRHIPAVFVGPLSAHAVAAEPPFAAEPALCPALKLRLLGVLWVGHIPSPGLGLQVLVCSDRCLDTCVDMCVDMCLDRCSDMCLAWTGAWTCA